LGADALPVVAGHQRRASAPGGTVRVVPAVMPGIVTHGANRPDERAPVAARSVAACAVSVATVAVSVPSSSATRPNVSACASTIACVAVAVAPGHLDLAGAEVGGEQVERRRALRVGRRRAVVRADVVLPSTDAASTAGISVEAPCVMSTSVDVVCDHATASAVVVNDGRRLGHRVPAPSVPTTISWKWVPSGG
jgi:hypothetical protein